MSIPDEIREMFTHATCLYSKLEVENALERMAFEISNLLEDSNPILLCVMIGGLVPLGNLLPHLNFPLEMDYVHASRYRGEKSGGTLTWKVEPSASLKDRTVLVVDDILDEGLTLAAILDYCREKGAKEVYSAVLVDKENARASGGVEQADFTALTVGNRFVFGYGMDYKEYLRNAPGIYAVDEEG